MSAAAANDPDYLLRCSYTVSSAVEPEGFTRGHLCSAIPCLETSQEIRDNLCPAVCEELCIVTRRGMLILLLRLISVYVTLFVSLF